MQRTRGWRSLLAGLISLALVLSIFHGWAFDGDDDVSSAVSIARSINDTGGKAPAHPASLHGDHCLTHVASMAPQETAVAIAYASHSYGDAAMQLPASADRLSPFKPPRA
ncbi:hypothetical protein JQ633_30575 [Bradyrhizobium tropiciagri]|uniref:hypothetical protein n=1 Tax=Bradyrhizobium tropiciagri TaxID=312253 RepID=UPI001BA8ADD2|nr:hypothetical protein [Bradyrhizobium tropiciagri]MBR0874739.1 hypothetical protein [Bradyrhizobium tropiciagri]